MVYPHIPAAEGLLYCPCWLWIELSLTVSEVGSSLMLPQAGVEVEGGSSVYCWDEPGSWLEIHAADGLAGGEAGGQAMVVSERSVAPDMWYQGARGKMGGSAEPAAMRSLGLLDQEKAAPVCIAVTYKWSCWICVPALLFLRTWTLVNLETLLSTKPVCRQALYHKHNTAFLVTCSTMYVMQKY